MLFNVGDVFKSRGSTDEYEILAGTVPDKWTLKVVKASYAQDLGKIFQDYWNTKLLESNIKDGSIIIVRSNTQSITPTVKSEVSKIRHLSYEELMAKLCAKEGVKVPVRRKPVVIFQPNVDDFDLLRDA